MHTTIHNTGEIKGKEPKKRSMTVRCELNDYKFHKIPI